MRTRGTADAADIEIRCGDLALERLIRQDPSERSETTASFRELCQSGGRTDSDVEDTTVVPNSELEPYVDAERAAAFLRIHPKTLMRLAREGKVPAYSFSEGTLLPTQPGQFTAPQVRSHIQPYQDPLAREP